MNSNLTAEWLENGYDIFTTTAPIKLYKTNQNRIPKQTFPIGLNPYGTIVVFAQSEYPFALYFSAQEEFAVNYNRTGWKRFSLTVEGAHNYMLGFDNDGLYVTVDTTKFYLQTK